MARPRAARLTYVLSRKRSSLSAFLFATNLTQMRSHVSLKEAMRTLTLQLVGKTPILLHRISRHQFREQLATRNEGQSIVEEAKEVMVKGVDGNPAVPVSWLWDAIRVGCSRITVEGKQLSLFSLQSVIRLPEGLLSLRDERDQIPTWSVYSSIQHAAPESKKSIAVVAPIFKDWRLTVNVSIGESITNELLFRVLREAGRVGIGLFHPPKKQFGQFVPI